MNSLNSKIAIACTSLVIAGFFGAVTAQAWEVDMSRRKLDFNRVSDQNRLPASTTVDETEAIFSRVFETVEPAQDIVIMNTENGFVPDVLRVKKGGSYRIHVINMNAKEKNVSFVLDAFSEQHNTLFGSKAKTFSIHPKVDGIFSFQCPETAVQGKLVVVPAASETERKPASY